MSDNQPSQPAGIHAPAPVGSAEAESNTQAQWVTVEALEEDRQRRQLDLERAAFERKGVDKEELAAEKRGLMIEILGLKANVRRVERELARK